MEAYATPPPPFYRTDTSFSAKISTLYLKRMDPALEVWVRLLAAQNEVSLILLKCLHSAFSLKIRVVLVSISAIANHDVMLQ